MSANRKTFRISDKPLLILHSYMADQNISTENEAINHLLNNYQKVILKHENRIVDSQNMIDQQIKENRFLMDKLSKAEAELNQFKTGIAAIKSMFGLNQLES